MLIVINFTISHGFYVSFIFRSERFIDVVSFLIYDIRSYCIYIIHRIGKDGKSISPSAPMRKIWIFAQPEA